MFHYLRRGGGYRIFLSGPDILILDFGRGAIQTITWMRHSTKLPPMDNKLPQYYQNTLQPITITEKSLDKSLSELINCLEEGLRELKENSIEARTYSDYGSIFNGPLGN